MSLIFEQAAIGRSANSQLPDEAHCDLPTDLLRTSKPLLPEVSELQTVRHYTRLSQRNFSIDTQFYPLGSCSMKYNPRGVHCIASMPGFLNRHPLALHNNSQGFMHCVYDLQRILSEVTGLSAVALSPLAGAQGEFAGVAMIRAYHADRGDHERTEFLVPDAAHGTNPASAVMCGFTVREIPTNKEGDVDLAALEAAVGPKTAGIMLTNPSTLGVFDRNIQRIQQCVHAAGGLLYYDGANLNAILGKVRPGDMGFDVMHINLHKTFATPHGGGGPGAGPVAVSARLAPYLPIPMVAKKGEHYEWITEHDNPKTIGRLTTFAGNAGIILRAYIYARLLGAEGMQRIAEYATLNANYLLARLQQAGYVAAFPKRRASHEFIITVQQLAKTQHITAMDIAKRLLDYQFHAPTTYFPLLVPECLLIEPTETECKEELDAFADAMIRILQEAEEDPVRLKQAPFTTPVSRLDDVKAARELDLVWEPEKNKS